MYCSRIVPSLKVTVLQQTRSEFPSVDATCQQKKSSQNNLTRLANNVLDHADKIYEFQILEIQENLKTAIFKETVTI